MCPPHLQPCAFTGTQLIAEERIGLRQDLLRLELHALLD